MKHKTNVLIALFLGLTIVVILCLNFESYQLKNEIVSKNGGELEWEWFITPGEYKDIILLDDFNLIGVKNETGKYGLINKNKELVIDYQYFNILGVGGDIVRVLDFDKNYTFINENGAITDETFSGALDFREGFAAVKENEKWGFIDTDGNLAIDYQFDNVSEGFCQGYAAVKKDELWGFINTDGDIVIECRFDAARNFNEGFGGVQMGDKWGFVDKAGEVQIEMKYDEVGMFSEGKAAVKSWGEEREKWAYINKQDEIIIDYFYVDTAGGRMLTAGDFLNGYALVAQTLYCLIDEIGETVLGEGAFLLLAGSCYNEVYEMVPAYKYEDSAMTVKKYGYIDIEGNPKIPFIFDYVFDISGNLILVGCMNDEELIRVVIALNE